MRTADFELVDTRFLHRVVGGADDPAAVQAALTERCAAKKRAAESNGTYELVFGQGRHHASEGLFDRLDAGAKRIAATAAKAESDCLAEGNGIIQNPRSGLSRLFKNLW